MTRGALPEDSRHLIEVRPTAGKGLGVFAKADIARNTMVLAEATLINTTGDFDPANVISAFNRLSDAKKQVYLGLHEFASPATRAYIEECLCKRWSAILPRHRRVLAIFAANNFDWEDVCPIGSRFNHSCAPNLNAFDDASRQRRAVFRARRNIGAGEELTVSYLHPSRESGEKRRRKLYESWGFQCKCSRCKEEEDRGKLRQGMRLRSGRFKRGI